MGERRAALALLAAALTAAAPAWAGPPYVTDDPEPTRTGGWENYALVSGVNTPGETAGVAGAELNYGAAENLQLSALLPLAFDSTHGLRGGTGDLQLSAKYRFFHPPEGSWLPDAAVFPALTLPTAPRRLDTGHASVFLPIWLEKDFGKWSTFGGGGYDINPGRGQRDYGLVGWAVTRAASKRLNLGVEVYHQTPQAIGGPAFTNLGFGAIYQLTKHWAVMASGGPGLQHSAHVNDSAFYASLQFTN